MGKKQYGGRPGRPKKRRFFGKQSKKCPAPESVSGESEDISVDDPTGVCQSECEDDGSSSEDNSSSESGADDEVDASGYCLVDLQCLQSLFDKGTSCKTCRGRVVLKEQKRDGLASTLRLVCESCELASSEAMSRKYKRVWEVNRRFVLGMRWIGRGHQAMIKLCAALNMPYAMSFPAYSGHTKELARCAKVVAAQSMNAAAAEVRKDREGVCNIAVTYDGTWMRRGFASLYGAFVAISWENGKVLDYSVLSRFCHKCTNLRSRLSSKKITEEQHAAGMASHDCMANTTSSAPAMESEAAKLIWLRSAESRQLRYTTFIGDGDTKSFKAVADVKPYGPGVLVRKEECVGHVQKRVGSNLRKLKKELKGQKLDDGLTLGGRGAGRLTDERIERLQGYYGVAIRNNSHNLQDMAKAIWASVLHSVSTDAKPQHHCCPTGRNSWCKWQQEQAGGPKHHHRPILSPAVLTAIKPVYIRLTERSLLERCLRGATQNRNECFNGIVWQMCPKTGFCSAMVVDTAVALATAIFNDGSASLADVLTEMGLPVGDFTYASLIRLDEDRRESARRKRSEETKKKRKKRRRIRKGVQEEEIEQEGTTYEAGFF